MSYSLKADYKVSMLTKAKQTKFHDRKANSQLHGNKLNRKRTQNTESKAKQFTQPIGVNDTQILQHRWYEQRFDMK